MKGMYKVRVNLDLHKSSFQLMSLLLVSTMFYVLSEVKTVLLNNFYKLRTSEKTVVNFFRHLLSTQEAAAAVPVTASFQDLSLVSQNHFN